MTRPRLREITAKDAHTFSAGSTDGECGAMTGGYFEAMLLERDFEARTGPGVRRGGSAAARCVGADVPAPRPRCFAGSENRFEEAVRTGGS